MIKLNGIVIKNVSVYKFLGLIIDKNLNWDEHVKSISKKISISIGIMHRLKHTLPNNILKLLYCSLIQSHINYGILVWGLNPINIKKIENLQKKAIRIIDRAYFLEHTEKLFKKYKILKASDILKHKAFSTFYAIKNGFCPTSIANLVTLNTNSNKSHYRDLRSGDLVIRNYVALSNITKFSLRYYLPLLINASDSDIITAANMLSLPAFKNFTKCKILDKYSAAECRTPNCYACRIKRRNFNNITHAVNDDISWYQQSSPFIVCTAAFEISH